MQKHNEHGDNMNIPPQTMSFSYMISNSWTLYIKKKIEFEITSEPKF